MRKILLTLCLTLITTSLVMGQSSADKLVSIHAPEPFGFSYNFRANGSIWCGILEYMQKTEHFSKLYDKTTIYYRHWDENQTLFTPTLGVALPVPIGVGVIVAQFNQNTDDYSPEKGEAVFTPGDNNIMYKNQNVYDLSEANSIDNLIQIGVGAGFNKKIGVMYILGIDNDSYESNYITSQVDISNNVQYKDWDKTIESKGDSGNTRHAIEGGINLGNLKATVNIQLISSGGDTADSARTETTETYTNLIPTAKRGMWQKTVVQQIGKTGFDTNNNFDPRELANTGFQTEAEVIYDIMGMSLFGVVELGTRSIEDDTTYVSDTETTTYNPTNGTVTGSSKKTTTTLFVKNKDSVNKFALKVKKKFKISDDLKVGIFPRYEIISQKADYDIKKEDVSKSGTTSVTTITSNGHDDNVLLEQSSHEFKFPIGMEAKITKTLTVRFGATLSYKIVKLKETKTDVSGYRSETRKTETSTIVNQLPYTTTTTEEETTEYDFTGSFAYGLGWEVLENFNIDLLGEVGGADFSIENYRFSTSYAF